MARTLHKWDLSPARARQLQESLRQRVIRTDSFKPLRTVAGCDLSFVKHSSIAYGGIILYSYPELEELERVWVKKQLSFPYVPGLLSFREGPVLLAAFRKLKRKPSLVIFDAQGYAHPRRFGLACHLGLWLDVPSIGCAKSRLCGEHGGPGKKKGSFAPLMAGKEQIGAVLRTRYEERFQIPLCRHGLCHVQNRGQLGNTSILPVHGSSRDGDSTRRGNAPTTRSSLRPPIVGAKPDDSRTAAVLQQHDDFGRKTAVVLALASARRQTRAAEVLGHRGTA